MNFSVKDHDQPFELENKFLLDDRFFIQPEIRHKQILSIDLKRKIKKSKEKGGLGLNRGYGGKSMTKTEHLASK